MEQKANITINKEHITVERMQTSSYTTENGTGRGRIPSEGSVSTRCVSITSPACTAWLVQARTPFRKMPSSVRFKPVIIWREYPCRRRNHSTVRFSRSSSGKTTYVNLCPIHKTSVSIAFLSNEPRHFGAKFQKETFPVFRKYSRKQMEKQETYLSIAKI